MSVLMKTDFMLQQVLQISSLQQAANRSSKGALGISGTGALYKDVKALFLPDRNHSGIAYAVYRTETW